MTPPMSTLTYPVIPDTRVGRTGGVWIGGQRAKQLVGGGAGRLGRAALKDGERAQQADGRVALVPAQVAAGIAVEIVDRHSESSAVAAELVELDRGEPADELSGLRPIRRRGPMPGDWIGRGGAHWTDRKRVV